MIRNTVRALRLDPQLYEAVEADPAYTVQAVVIVVVTAFLAGVPDWWGAADGSIPETVRTIIAAVILWVVWSSVTLIIGTRLFEGDSDFGQMSRVLGFASAPRALFVFGGLGVILGAVWMMLAGFMAVRQGLDLGWLQAAATIVLGLFPAAAIYFVVTGVVL